jgi:chromatin structure-remodeling complex subunit RSC1/2
VCESRYNDLTKAFSKINQWRACLPEEVRFDEDELFQFERQRQYERFPSPLMSLLKGDEKIIGEDDKLPEPVELGSEDGPPTVGAIYRGDSPEPEKEPTPPPPPPQPVHGSRTISNLDSMSSLTPGLPQPMPYKNPGMHGYPQQSYRPLPPQQQLRYPSSAQGRQPPPPPPPSEQPLAFTMPIAVPQEVAELVARDNQGRVLWFGVPPVDVVGWSGGEGIKGHSLEYLAKKRKKAENGELMQDIQTTETSEERGYKKRATEVLVKALGMIGK